MLGNAGPFSGVTFSASGYASRHPGAVAVQVCLNGHCVVRGPTAQIALGRQLHDHAAHRLTVVVRGLGGRVLIRRSQVIHLIATRTFGGCLNDGVPGYTWHARSWLGRDGSLESLDASATSH